LLAAAAVETPLPSAVVAVVAATAAMFLAKTQAVGPPRNLH
jgi:hypothetical protein